MNDIMSTPGHSNYLEFGGSSANDQSGGSNNQNQGQGQNQPTGTHHLEFHGLQTYHHLPMQQNRPKQFLYGDNQSHYSLQPQHSQGYQTNNEFIMGGSNDPNNANQPMISPSLPINSMIPLDPTQPGHSLDPQVQHQQLGQPLAQHHALHQQANQQHYPPFHPYGNPAMIFQQPSFQPMQQYGQPSSNLYNTNQLTSSSAINQVSPSSSSRRPRLHQQTSSRSSKSSHSRTSSSSTIPEYPEILKPKIATILWEEANTTCYQVRARGILVSRREDTDYINGTKLLNVIGMTRGKRDGILKTEKVRNVVKVGSMNLKGVWIPFERAYEIARNEGVEEILFPLFVNDLKLYYNTKGHLMKSGKSEDTGSETREGGSGIEIPGSDNEDNDTTLIGSSSGNTSGQAVSTQLGDSKSRTILTPISAGAVSYSRPGSSGERIYLDSLDTTVSVKEENLSYYSTTEQTPNSDFKP